MSLKTVFMKCSEKKLCSVSLPYGFPETEWICCANQLTGFYMMATLGFNGLMFSLL